MCGRYAIAMRMALIREQLEMDGMDVDEEIPPDDAVRQSYNVAPGYFEPVYRAVVEGADRTRGAPQDNSGGTRRNAASDEAEATEGDGDDGQENAGDEGAGTDDQERGGDTGKVKYILSPMKWGLIPFWTKRSPDYANMLRTINCRDDSLADNKGMWTTMKNRKRCIILAQGFFEWLNKGKDKVPHFTKRTDGKLLLLAGLWDCVKYEDAKEELYTYTIITTSSSKQLTFLHDRMPVIFDPGSPEIKMWLDPLRKWDMGLQKLLKPYEKPGLECYPVKKEVGKVGNNSPLFIVPLDSAENKSNIKHFFAAGNKKAAAKKSNDDDLKRELKGLKVEDTTPTKEVKAEDDATEEDVKAEGDSTENDDTEEEEDLDDENTAPNAPEDIDPNALERAPDPTALSPHRSPTKQLHITPKSAKRKLSDLTPDASMKPPQINKTPSPIKSQLSSYYSSSNLGSSPKKGGNPFSSPNKKQKKSPDAKDLGNKSITSFFGKK